METKSRGGMAVARRKRVRVAGLLMTPMIDIVFLLIAFFIFTLNYEEISATVTPPETAVETTTGDDLQPVLLEIDGEGRLLTSEAPLLPTDPQYAATIESAIVAAEPNQPIVIRADAAAPYESLKLALAACRRQGRSHVALRLRNTDR